MERAFFLKGLAAISATGIGLRYPVPSEASNPNHQGMTPLVPPTKLEDWDELKKHFSLPEGYCYLNTAGIGAVPIQVRQEVDQFWTDSEIHPKPGHDELNWKMVKQSLAKCIGAGADYSTIALTNSATEGINIILNGMDFKAGDEIICSTHEHPALHVPLINISKRKGLIIRSFEPDLRDGLNNISRITNLFNSRTRLVFVSLVTCTTGQWLPIEELLEVAHQKGILVALDGAQSTGTRPLNLHDWKVDFYTSGGQKWLLGPKRTGLFYIREDHLDRIHPVTVGAYSEESYDLLKGALTWSKGAARYEYATQNDGNFYGLRKSVEFLQELGLEAIQEHNESLAEHLYNGLRALPGVNVFSPEEKAYRTSIISFGLKSMDFMRLSGELSKLNFRVRVVTEAGLEAVRASIHLYNSKKEIDDLIQAIGDLSRKS